MHRATPSQLTQSIIVEPYAFPGGYPKYALTDDGGALCRKCCEAEQEQIQFSYPKDGWHVVSIEINWEDNDLYCDNCYGRIESAYGEGE